MKFIRVWLCITACLLIMPENVWPHGIRGTIGPGNGVLIEAEYDDGEPVSYASIEIFDLEEKLPFQSGRTDKNGRFLFYPDKGGDWKVVVNDGMGHRLVLKANIDKMLGPKKTDEQQDKSLNDNSLPKYAKVLIGISIIFGIFGFFFWWKGKRIYRDINRHC